MRPRLKTPQGCPAEEAMEVFGGKWRVGIIHHLAVGPLRFNELCKTARDYPKDAYSAAATLTTIRID